MCIPRKNGRKDEKEYWKKQRKKYQERYSKTKKNPN